MSELVEKCTDATMLELAIERHTNDFLKLELLSVQRKLAEKNRELTELFSKYQQLQAEFANKQKPVRETEYVFLGGI